jgi:hypothetical protein
MERQQTLEHKGPMGPLDVVREINQQAEALDMLMMESGEIGKTEANFIVDTIDELDSQHPLLNQEVIIFGQLLHPNTQYEPSHNGMPFLVMPVEGERSPQVKGIYRGLEVRPVYVDEHEYMTDRIVHLVDIFAQRGFDRHFYPVKTDIQNSVCAYGSEVVPFSPVNAHSLIELKNDRVVAQIDEIAFSDKGSVAEKLGAIGVLMNAVLKNSEFDEDRNRQRVSYINSLELLRSVYVSAPDLVLSSTLDMYIDDGPGNEGYQMDNEVFFPPGVLHILPRRNQTQDGLRIGGYPELCIVNQTDDDRIGIVSFDRVTNIVPII